MLDAIDPQWLRRYTRSLSELRDEEIRWELDLWRAAGLTELAEAREAILRDRARTGTALAGGADAACLTGLLRRVNPGPVGRLFDHEALSLVEAARLVYWHSLREVEP